jgi:hypothetical protein
MEPVHYDFDQWDARQHELMWEEMEEEAPPRVEAVKCGKCGRYFSRLKDSEACKCPDCRRTV